jgi:predicted SAM-dependent methyltransferase
VSGPNVLDLGCGNKKRPGAIGIDINPDTDADVVHDLDAFPYPFEDSYFDEVYADNVLEHLSDLIGVMEELHRICKPGALVKVIVPYFRSRWAFIDPTHRHFFTVDSMSYFDPDHVHSRLYNYSRARFTTERVVFNETVPVKPLLKRLANRWPVRYESRLSHLMPLDDLTFYLRVVK